MPRFASLGSRMGRRHAQFRSTGPDCKRATTSGALPVWVAWAWSVAQSRVRERREYVAANRASSRAWPELKRGAAVPAEVPAINRALAPHRHALAYSRRMAKTPTEKQNSGFHLGFEATLWATADKLRGNLDAAEYKHVVLGLIFLKYISDAFEEKHAALSKEKGADPEDRDEYTADNIFWVPPEARWSYLQGRAKDPVIGKLLDNAMIAIERA